MPNPRNQLLTLEKRRQLLVVREFQKIEVRLMSEIADILERIEKQRRIDGNASPGLLIQKARLSQLLDAVTDEIKAISKRLGLITTAGQKSAIEIAKAGAGEYPQLAADLTFFDGPATKELIGLAGNGQPLELYFETLAKPARQAMFDALFFGVAAGRANYQIAKEVREAIGSTTARAMTIVRTETNRAYREATRKFYDDTPAVIGWRWLAALDLNTCPICWALHGRVFKTKTKFGTHPNCRCTMVPVFAGDADVETGPELFARLNDTQKRAILGPRRLDLYNKGAELKDFVETNKTVFGIGRNVKTIKTTTFKPNPRTPVEPVPGRGLRTPPRVGPAPPVPASLPAITIDTAGPIPTFDNAGHAAAYMQARYPGTSFNYFGMDLSLIQSNAAEMARLMDLYPDVAARIFRVETATVGVKGANAFHEFNVVSERARIVYNVKNAFNDGRDFRTRKKRAFEIGWSASDKDFSTTTHEFGHAVDHWLQSKSGGRSTFDFAFADGRHEIRDIYFRIQKELKPKYGELSDYAIQGRGDRQKAEQFAEGFNMMHNRPEKDWPPYVRAMKLFIDTVRDRYIFNEREQTALANLSPAEQEKARAEFEAFIKSLGLKVKK